LILWAGDGPLNARDGIIEDIEKQIDESLKEAEADPAFLNYTVAYLRCLTGVLREVGGEQLVFERIPEWRRRTLHVYDAKKHLPEKAETDREFLTSVFEELTKLCSGV
jgi:hypothetical protein